MSKKNWKWNVGPRKRVERKFRRKSFAYPKNRGETMKLPESRCQSVGQFGARVAVPRAKRKSFRETRPGNRTLKRKLYVIKPSPAKQIQSLGWKRIATVAGLSSPAGYMEIALHLPAGKCRASEGLWQRRAGNSQQPSGSLLAWMEHARVSPRWKPYLFKHFPSWKVESSAVFLKPGKTAFAWKSRCLGRAIFEGLARFKQSAFDSPSNVCRPPR